LNKQCGVLSFMDSEHKDEIILSHTTGLYETQRHKHLIMSEEKLTKICAQALKTFMRLIVAPFFLFILINWPQIMDDGAAVIVLL